MSENTFYNTDSHLYMVEDDLGDAEDYVKALDKIISENNVAYITNIDEMSNEILQEDKLIKKIFWVDVNLGAGRKTEGFEIISLIRGRLSHALIIVHTAYADYEKTCLELGADHFFVKKDSEKTTAEIKAIINAYINKKNAEKNTIEYRAQVTDIDLRKGYIKLDCDYNDAIVDGYVPMQLLSIALREKIERGQLVRIKIEFGDKTSISIDADEQKNDDDSLPSNLLRPDGADMLNNDFWSDKL